MNKGRGIAFLFSLLGLAVSTVPVGAVILSYFPIWAGRGGVTFLSGLTLLLLLLAIVPIFKLIRKHLESPSAPVMWFIAFIAFFSLSKISDEVTVISFVGFTSNLLGALFFKLSDKYKAKAQRENEG